MRKSLFFVTGAASILVMLLFSLPKVIVNDANEKLATQSSHQGAAASANPADQIETTHSQSLNPEQVVRINQLRNNCLSEPNTEKKLKFADSLAVLFSSASRFDSAAKYLDLIATIKPSEVNLVRAGDGYYEAFKFAVNSIKESNLVEKTRFFYQKALDKNANLLDVKSKMAMTYVTSANPMQGIMMLREVIAKDPKNELALFNLGILSMQSGQYERAVERFKQILALNPRNTEAQLYLGISYSETGKQQAAKEIFNQLKVTEKDPAIQATVAEYLQKLN